MNSGVAGLVLALRLEDFEQGPARVCFRFAQLALPRLIARDRQERDDPRPATSVPEAADSRNAGRSLTRPGETPRRAGMLPQPRDTGRAPRTPARAPSRRRLPRNDRRRIRRAPAGFGLPRASSSAADAAGVGTGLADVAHRNQRPRHVGHRVDHAAPVPGCCPRAPSSRTSPSLVSDRRAPCIAARRTAGCA